MVMSTELLKHACLTLAHHKNNQVNYFNALILTAQTLIKIITDLHVCSFRLSKGKTITKNEEQQQRRNC